MKPSVWILREYAKDIEDSLRIFSDSQDFQSGFFWKTHDTTEIFLEEHHVRDSI